MTPEQFFVGARSLPAPAAPCVRTADEWVRLCSGRSTIEAGKVCLDTDEDAAGYLERTSLPRMIHHCMRSAGFPMTRDPQVGDVAAIVVIGKIVCAVRGSRMWLYRGDDGFGSAALDARCLGAWRIA